jgi:uncharacterized protein (TIGR02996 family)
VTTEEEFQNHLDANPKDWKTRLLFADWLDARRDPRGPGYRALALRQRRPSKSKETESWYWFDAPSVPYDETASCHLWRDWFALLPAGEGDPLFWPKCDETAGIKTRRECEDAAALAFAQLPSERQAELLAPRPSR